jgi:prolyl oligopeptidase
MKRIHSLIVAALFGAIVLGLHGCANSRTPEANHRVATTRPAYPLAKTVDITEDYHGTKIADPYRWLEDADAADTKAFVDAQNALFHQFVDGPLREGVKQRLVELHDYPRYTPPSRHGPYYTFNKNDGLQNQSVLYVSTSAKDPSPRVLIDPNTFRKDGTMAVSGTTYTHDGTLLAYGISSGGSDQKEIHVLNVQSGKDLGDVLKWCKFANVAWKHDNSGFWYNRYPTPGSVAKEDQARFNKLYWHTLGTPQEQDALVLDPGDKDLSASPSVTDDGEYLLLYLSRGSGRKNRLYYRKAADSGEFVKLFEDEQAQYSFVEHDGPVFYILTNRDAPRKKLVAVDTSKRDAADSPNWKTIIPEGHDTIGSVECINNQFLVTILHDAHELMTVYDMNGQRVREIELPTLGSVSGASGQRTHTETFFSFTSYIDPPTIYRYDFVNQKLELLRKPEVKFDSSRYETKQVFVTSKDGTTKVPMFITHKKGLKLDGNNPTMLNGYGGFTVSLTPGFSTARIVWLENGGVFCVANLRGGDEYGEAWHRAGMLENKQNVFDDFIACAQWLIDNKYTSTRRLAIEGGSNGGLLVAACEAQRPDLFGAVLCHVPLTDMLRYHRFSVGRFWTTEYGNAEKDPEQFKFLYSYSPLHHVTSGTVYPPTAVFTAEMDDRVVPLHARKFTAALQAADAGTNPILLRTETRAGHGGGKPTSKQIDEEADQYAFLARVFGMRFDQTP